MCVILVSEVVEFEVAENGEIGEKDDEGVQHYHPTLNDEGIVCANENGAESEQIEQ